MTKIHQHFKINKIFYRNQLRNNYSLNETFQRVNYYATKNVTLNDLRKEVKNIKLEVQELRNFISEHEN